jgi:hypothetical protein
MYEVDDYAYDFAPASGSTVPGGGFWGWLGDIFGGGDDRPPAPRPRIARPGEVIYNPADPTYRVTTLAPYERPDYTPWIIAGIALIVILATQDKK